MLESLRRLSSQPACRRRVSQPGLDGVNILCSCCSMKILPACTAPPGCPLQAERPRCWLGLRNPPLPSYEGSESVVGEKMAVGHEQKSKQTKKTKKMKQTFKQRCALREERGGTMPPRLLARPPTLRTSELLGSVVQVMMRETASRVSLELTKSAGSIWRASASM